MDSKNLPIPEPEQYDPNLDGQDEDVVSGGNNRLIYILVAVVVVLVLGYVALPKGQGSGLAAATPTFMLDDAAVTATAPTAADSIAAGLKTAPAAAKTTEEETKTTAKTSVAPVVTAIAPIAVSKVTAAPAVAAPVAAPEPVVVAAPTPAAPTTETMAGKIVDENGRPLVGATVLLKGSSKGTSTDANGNYTLEVPADNENTLIYGYGGYEDEVVHSTSNKPMNVTLMPRAKESRKRH